MKKKKSLIVLCALFCFIFAGTTASAQPANESVDAVTSEDTIEYLEDGSYIVTTTQDVNPEISVMSKTKSGYKTSTYYNVAHQKQWSITVNGTYTYGDGSATCTSATISTAIYNNDWGMTGKSASKSGNRASATATAIHYVQGHEVERITKTVTQTCSKLGILS